MSEGENQAQAGNETAQPSTDIDNPANWDYYDPDDEKQDTVKAKPPKGNEGEKAEVATSDQEAEQSDETNVEEGDDEETPEGENPKVADDESILVKLADGKQVSIAELKQGYFRQSDYSRKTEATAQKSAFLDTQLHQSQERLQALEAFVSHVLPPRPDPSLAQTNPGQFVAMQATYQQAVDMMGYVQNMAAHNRAAFDESQKQEMFERVEAERPMMLQALPSLGTDKGKRQFFDKAKEVAEASGKNPGFIGQITDHTDLVLLNYAIEGFAARKAKSEAKAKVANVPPVTPQKQKLTRPGTVTNREAMSRLGKTGSIHDAMNVDFD